MKRTISLLAAGAIAATPAIAMASPPSSGAPAMRPSTTTTTTSPSTTTRSPAHVTGQPMQSCETTGTTPGNSASNNGSAFSSTGKSGTKYAGEQPQNSRNTAAMSQYDVACANQPPK